MNTSSQLEQLSSNELGHVLYCPSAKNMMIGFGTVMLKFPPDDCRFLLQTLHGLKCQFNCPKECRSKAFIQTPVSNMMIALNKTELAQVIELIEVGLLRLEVEELLNAPGGAIC